MTIANKIKSLHNKDNTIAYKALQEWAGIASETEDALPCFGLFLLMVKGQNSFIIVRVFRLICYLVKLGSNNLIKENINAILNALDDNNNNNNNSIRQCLRTINILLLQMHELSTAIENKLITLYFFSYKKSTQSLITQDTKNIHQQL